MRIIGIDVGGTNTDATLISEDRQVLAMAKTTTNHEDILLSTKTVLKEILDLNGANHPAQLHLSTTLSTNAIIEGKGDPTAVLVIPGPGVNIQDFEFDFPIYSLTGYVDHRGRQVKSLNSQEVLTTVQNAVKAGAQSLAIVGKFSQRNNQLETAVQDLILATDYQFNHITLGSQLSGRLNFPRRVMSAFLNSSVASLQKRFVAMIEALVKENPLIKEVRILKADGGTMSLSESCIRPVETILSGPAASIVAAQALASYEQDNYVIVDIGGTTTDIAVIVGGEALDQRGGAVIEKRRTLVPALLTDSIGLGGDSEIRITSGEIKIGPRRAGRAIALGGSQITPTDAVVALGLVELGDRQRAIAALTELAITKDQSWQELATTIIDEFVAKLSGKIEQVYTKLEQEPVYTVSEILAPPDIRPRCVVGLGAPAEFFVPLVAQKLNLPDEILPYYAGANGIGAAAARPTAALTLHVDTEQEQLIIPEIGFRKQIKRGMLFDQKRARKLAFEEMTNYAKKIGLGDIQNVQIVEEEAFNLVRGFRTVGRIINIRVQIRPGVNRIVGDRNVES